MSTMRLCRRLTAPTVLLTALAVGCGETPFTLSATGPYVYSSTESGSLDRMAVVATIANHANYDLVVDPVEFVVRDEASRVYPSNAAASVADARRLSDSPGTRGILAMPVITLRGDDIVTGFVVFDVPRGTRAVELIWRQIDSDAVARIATPP